MKVELKEEQGLYRELTLEFEKGEFADKLEEVYNYLAATANIPGFRRGRIPKKILRKRLKGEVERLLANAVLENYLDKAFEEAGVKPVADVFLTDVNLDGEEKLTLKVKFEVAPEFEVKNPEEITVEIPKTEFSEKLVEDYIAELRERNAEWKPVEREVKEGDLVEVEYEITDVESGETEKGETAAVVGEGLFRKEIEEALKGKKAGDGVELEELPIYDQDGKEIGRVNIKLKIKAVKEKVLPELNDEFAKKLGLGETWEEAKRKIEERVKEDFERAKENLKRERLLSKLVEEHKIEVPETLVRRELENLIKVRLAELERLGINPKQVNQQALAQELLPVAVFNVAIRLILDKYADKLGVEVSDEEVEKELENLAKLSNISPEEFKALAKQQGLYEGVRADLRRNKAIEELLKKVKFFEVEPKKEEEKKETEKEG